VQKVSENENENENERRREGLVGGEGEADAHRGAGAAGGVERYVAVMGEQDAFGNGEAEACAICAPREKTVENVVGEFGRDAGAGIYNVNHGLARAPVFLDRDGDRDGAAMGHGLGGVDEEVKQNLLELALVDIHLEREGRGREAKTNFTLGELEADEHEGIAHDIGKGPAGVEAGRCFGELEHT